jgi:hypothetical protein
MAPHGESRGLVWEWVHGIAKGCGFPEPSRRREPGQWVRSNPILSSQELPGVPDDVLNQVRVPGGSLEDKLEKVINSFLCSARHLEGLQQVLRRRALEEQSARVAPELPAEVIKVIDSGYYGDRFLKDFDGKTFPISSEEVIPGHEYCLALEVHSGGAYWSHLPASDESSGNNKVETVSASSSSEGSAGMLSHYGAAQRGAVFVWRWRRLPALENESLPGWLIKALSGESNDPLRKLQSELEAVRRWQQRAVLDTALHAKKGMEVKDPYVREVLRLWPCHGEQGGELKTCAWVEGLDPKLFIGKNVVVARLAYDEDHTFVLHAVMSKRHCEDEPDGSNPPYTLKTTWGWSTGAPPAYPPASAGGRADKASNAQSTAAPQMAHAPLQPVPGSGSAVPSPYADFGGA